jgi:hypothetical protein
VTLSCSATGSPGLFEVFSMFSFVNVDFVEPTIFWKREGESTALNVDIKEGRFTHNLLSFYHLFIEFKILPVLAAYASPRTVLQIPFITNQQRGAYLCIASVVKKGIC